MRSYLTELFYGNLEPLEIPGRKKAEARRLANKVCEKEKALMGVLEAEAEQFFASYTEAVDRCHAVALESAFVQGFRLGAGFIYEAFAEESL